MSVTFEIPDSERLHTAAQTRSSQVIETVRQTANLSPFNRHKADSIRRMEERSASDLAHHQQLLRGYRLLSFIA